jgi:squalene-hopene/tetraprenyl-beta-curcumene cyclase
MVERAAGWLASAANADGGWGGAPGCPSSIEETALAVGALAGVGSPPAGEAVARGVGWLIDRTDRGRSFEAAPIGLYFARLWYFERLYPIVFTVAALARAGPLLARA